ncbi:alpha/beta hydrolase fold domain-containing protein [Sarocladium implicatum]|nr:alpha/beta hydrolase fold domain-containing protein [Sarocladium implicatum]
MPGLNTTSVSLAVTPTVVSTLFSHYLNKKSLRQRPTAHLSYDEGLHLIRSFLDHASHHTVEDLQAFTAQWVPHPQWVKVKEDNVPEAQLKRAADMLIAQLGEDGIRQVGGRQWWQWRIPNRTLDAEWIEMKSHYSARKTLNQPATRVMMYIHGGAYFFGSVDEHRYQMQRHARKLKARVFAPKYRLAPQFPFPCGLLDCLAAYLHLLTIQDPSTIILAGDSAGAGMAMSLMVILRDQGIPLPAGAILISPWVDLTHSFPSVAGDAPLDYIPQAGFHHKPSRSWPPPNEDDDRMLQEEAAKLRKNSSEKAESAHALKQKQQAPVAPKSEDEVVEDKAPAATGGIVAKPEEFLSVTIDGEEVIIKDQIQMYTTNRLLEHPLVSTVMQPTLGGLPPMLIMVGSGEILRDEQIFIAHKCANPAKYAPPADTLTEEGAAKLKKYKPTDVQLQVWDDLCHVAPTLSFTRPAKYMYRSVAQFGAWALARAQRTGIEIIDDDDISVISSDSTTEADEESEQKPTPIPGSVGKAGDPLPRFKNHMIRQRVTRHGITHPLAPESELHGCCVSPDSIGKVKEGPVRKWLSVKGQWDSRFASAKAKVHKRTINDMVVGYQPAAPGENPPPTALAGRIRKDEDFKEKSKRKSLGLAMWSLWGSKHDEETVEREQRAQEAEDQAKAAASGDQQNPESETTNTRPDGGGTETFPDAEAPPNPPFTTQEDRSRSRRRTVVDEHQTDSVIVNEDTPVQKLVELRKEREEEHALTPDFNKRPSVGGIAMPFTLNKEAETASMMTLNSGMSPVPGSRPMSPENGRESMQTGRDDAGVIPGDKAITGDGYGETKSVERNENIKPANGVVS